MFNTVVNSIFKKRVHIFFWTSCFLTTRYFSSFRVHCISKGRNFFSIFWISKSFWLTRFYKWIFNYFNHCRISSFKDDRFKSYNNSSGFVFVWWCHNSSKESFWCNSTFVYSFDIFWDSFTSSNFDILMFRKQSRTSYLRKILSWSSIEKTIVYSIMFTFFSFNQNVSITYRLKWIFNDSFFEINVFYFSSVFSTNRNDSRFPYWHNVTLAINSWGYSIVSKCYISTGIIYIRYIVGNVIF